MDYINAKIMEISAQSIRISADNLNSTVPNSIFFNANSIAQCSHGNVVHFICNMFDCKYIFLFPNINYV
jgi:hypothetical protein